LMTDERIPALLVNLNRLTEEARGLVDAQNRADLKQILADLAQVTHALAAHRAELADALAQSDITFERFAAVGKTMDEQLPPLLREVSASLHSLHNVTQELGRAAIAVASIADGSRADIRQFTGETLPDTASLVTELRQLTATMQRLASDLERQPNALIFGRTPPPPGPGE
ncbi:MAG TPA: hypothetical protein VE131_01580, partial [Terriglobales bacterium]|nr:hypothetical protein [Terriglobales bacterium]